MTDDPIANMRAAAEAAIALEGNWPWTPLPEGETPMLGKHRELEGGMTHTSLVGIPAEVLQFFAAVTPLRVVTLIDMLRQAMTDAEEADDLNKMLREAQGLVVTVIPGGGGGPGYVPMTPAPSGITPTDATDQGRAADARDPE